MKSFFFFFFLWFLSIFFQSFFDVIITFLKVNVIYCIYYSIFILCRKSIFAIYSFILGLTYDYLSFSPLGIYAIAFFLVYYAYDFFNIRSEQLLKHFFFSFFLFCSIHFVAILLNFVFFNESYIGLFFRKTLFSEIIPTIILLMGVYPLLKIIFSKLNIINEK